MFQQFEILIEGMNPEAGGPLSETELVRVRATLTPDEHLGSFMRGRVVGAGSALWVLTEQRLLRVPDKRRRAVNTLALAAVQRVTLEAGRYGSTVALYTADQRLSLFAAHAGLARAFVVALGRSLPAGVAPAVDTSLTPAEEAADIATWVSWSRLQLLPTPRPGMADKLVLLQEAASLHERGLLNETEYAALKGRLLNAA